jgi:predicted nucleic-acid-binding protein
MKTKYLDTNIIVRLFMEDSEDQSEIIKTELISASQKKSKLFVSVLVIFEVEWVLRSVYKVDKQNIADSLQDLFATPYINFENIDILEKANSNYQQNYLGLEDNYHIAYCLLADMEFYSFDKKAKNEYLRLCS